ncbi:UNVERIFIED_CONTAM: hypothetical protein FKN15_019000 [Acipenser sinensis]
MRSDFQKTLNASTVTQKNLEENLVAIMLALKNKEITKWEDTVAAMRSDFQKTLNASTVTQKNLEENLVAMKHDFLKVQEKLTVAEKAIETASDLRIDLQSKYQSLSTELDFVAKTHEEELASLQVKLGATTSDTSSVSMTEERAVFRLRLLENRGLGAGAVVQRGRSPLLQKLPTRTRGGETPTLGLSLEGRSPSSRRMWSTAPSRSSTLLRYPLPQTRKKTLQRSWV